MSALPLPTQAVILAGGQGTRLRPLTDNLPKPLIPFHGRPFLSYLLDQLAEQGIKEVLLLVGYLGEKIRQYCRDGSYWRLDIRYVESPVGAETGQRIRDAAPLLSPHFLLMYCDNYWPMNLSAMWQTYQEQGHLAMVTVYSNRDGYTRDNMVIGRGGRVEAYDFQRRTPGLQGVEIGYGLMSRQVLEYLPSGNVSFEHTVYPALVQQGQLGAFLTEHRYYSVGSHQRLPLTEAFLRPQKAVILDRDGVLNVRPPRAQYVRTWEEFQWLPGSLEALRLLSSAGYKLVVATNQPGIARGEMTQEALTALHQHMKEDMARAGASLEAVYHCPHGWDEGCFCRKPQPGLLFQAQRELHLDLTRTPFIGDDERDRQAGESAGCPTTLVCPDRSLLDVARELVYGGPTERLNCV